MGSSLELRCTSCGKITNHTVTKTEPYQYRWDDSHQILFESITGQDINYRLRQRTCTQCKHGVETVEMEHEYLVGLIRTIDTQQRQIMLAGKIFESTMKGVSVFRKKQTNALEMAGAIMLIHHIFGESEEEMIKNANLPIDTLRASELVDVIIDVTSSLSSFEKQLLNTRYSLNLDLTCEDDELPRTEHESKNTSLNTVLRKLRHPTRSERLRLFL